MTGYIGVVDLTVRLSSMNPLSLIDVNKANGKLERQVMRACLQVLQNTPASRRDALMVSGIVHEGATAKFFELHSPEQLSSFLLKLRSTLLQETLPFKICVRVGELGRRSLGDRWGHVLEAAKGQSLDQKTADELNADFGTRDPKEAANILALYGATRLHDDALRLSLDFEAFKGFGIALDIAADDPFHAVASGTFRNHFPVKRANKPYGVVEYFDLKFATDTDDIVERFFKDNATPDETNPDEDASATGKREPLKVIEETVPAGSTPMIEEIFRLLNRSFAADPDSANYYISILNTFARSSFYGDIEYLSRSKTLSSSGRKRTAGWQKFPPIFGALLMNAANIKLMRRVAATDLLLGSIVDEIYSSSCNYSETSASVSSSFPLGEGDSLKLEKDGRMKPLFRIIERSYGAGWLTKMLSLPATAISDNRKRAILELMTNR